jgi:hypothetical protein
MVAIEGPPGANERAGDLGADRGTGANVGVSFILAATVRCLDPDSRRVGGVLPTDPGDLYGWSPRRSK